MNVFGWDEVSSHIFHGRSEKVVLNFSGLVEKIEKIPLLHCSIEGFGQFCFLSASSDQLSLSLNSL
jgi:hypothetical protein